MEEVLHIGVTGFSAQAFDEARAVALLVDHLDEVQRRWPARRYLLVSGWTDLGVPALAYREAARRGWETVGVACARAVEYPRYPVDEGVLVGDEWGEESPTFLARIDVLVRIGGGAQAHAEVAAFTGPTLEGDL